jgi:aryl-alcohol dehydrogenase-like predicted oxidoreductase
MQQRRLGSSGIETGAIGLGCMGMSWGYGQSETDDDESIRVIHRALDLGCTLLDTADVYGPFTNEELVGRAIATRRDEAVVATKCGLVVHDAATYDMRPDGRPEHIREACEASLRRLGVEAIDLYYLHRADPQVPLEESVGALAGLVSAGKVRAIGLSEVSIAQLERAQAIHPLAAVQMELSLWTRDAIASGVVQWCAEHDVAVVCFSPLGRGFLTGAVQSADALEAGDFRRTLPRFASDAVEANQAITERVRAIADRLGATPAQVALAWVLAQGDHVVPIPGTKRLRYLEQNLAAADVQLSAEDLAELDGLPPAEGARYAAGARTAPTE